MAKARECDICGALYKNYTAHKNAPNGIMLVDITVDTYYRHDLYDLCPECMERVLNLLEDLKSSKKEV